MENIIAADTNSIAVAAMMLFVPMKVMPDSSAMITISTIKAVLVELYAFICSVI